jgi:hypothetical protein
MIRHGDEIDFQGDPDRAVTRGASGGWSRTRDSRGTTGDTTWPTVETRTISWPGVRAQSGSRATLPRDRAAAGGREASIDRAPCDQIRARCHHDRPTGAGNVRPAASRRPAPPVGATRMATRPVAGPSPRHHGRLSAMVGIPMLRECSLCQRQMPLPSAPRSSSAASSLPPSSCAGCFRA